LLFGELIVKLIAIHLESKSCK